MTLQIGFSDGYLESLTKLQPNLQRKTNQMVMKFKSNPTSSGLNFEKLNAMPGSNLRSLRVDQAYRVIVLAPDDGGVFLFLWVDHHDAAYAWALRHQCKVNPTTGVIQLYSVEVVDEALVDAPAVPNQIASFEGLKDRELLRLGIPAGQLELVRRIYNEDDLDKLQRALPSEAYENLFLIIAGESYDDLLREQEVDENITIDEYDFSAALQRAQSKAKFVVPESEEELNQLLNAPLEKWRVFLHPSQHRIAAGKKNGAVRVLGGAGTGKTVVAMHRAKWLAQQPENADKKILFTTFTKNLAVDIEHNLKSICSVEEMGRIEVVNIDQWVQKFLRNQTYDYTLSFDNKVLDQCWDRAVSEKPPELDFSASFLREEWQRVVQPQGVTTIDEYKKASRIGRGTRLNREERVRLWPVFEEYRHQLDRKKIREADDVYRDAAALINCSQVKLPYAAVVVDEAQDMGSQAFSLLRAIVAEGPNDLFIVGDAHQRIYGRNRVVLGRCGINIRGRSHKLKINYRTTDEIRKWAVGLLEGRLIDDLDGETDDNHLYKSLTHGAAPKIECFSSAHEQAGFIKSLLEQSTEPRSHTCVVARTNNEVEAIRSLLESQGVSTMVIKRNEATKTQDDAVKLATVHRVKGLEFDQLILASANQGLVPLYYALQGKADQVSASEAETEERSLVYVAITRARKQAFILGYGQLSEFFTA